MQVAPRPFGEVLGHAVNTFGRTWRALAPPALLVFVPAGLATLLLFRGTGAIEVFDRILNDPSTMQTLPLRRSKIYCSPSIGPPFSPACSTWPRLHSSMPRYI